MDAWCLSFAPELRLQRGDDVIRIHRFRKIAHAPEFNRPHGSRNIAVAGQNDGARFGSLLLERRNDIQALSSSPNCMSTTAYSGALS